ncbi:unnamed protein product [Rotaria sordida]|uniref:Uncharacterized protein n=1 Tax=Rotaria sordida TaxID=392033 RepID=A0A813PJW9_9BILA|nr:unnamed protein product [Rotaria sordida]CAF0797471.1 unnamed protein product [Rotaria sordida]CAF0880936.1 unnamed protein product [Rotaria sordida]CAF3676540.1 unnamed protein product [Rotaria sordida]
MTTIDDNKKDEKDTEELKRLNELFSKRYTNEDEEYIQMTQRSNSPPVVPDWNQERNTHRSQQFNNNNNNQRRYFSNDRQSYRNFSNNHHSYRNSSNNHHSSRNRSRSPYRDTRQ